MPAFTLQAETASGELLKAVFNPEMGMRLTSLTLGSAELIGEGSGPIGPHFGERKPEILPKRDQASRDPFPDGVARFAPWKAEMIGNTIRARISGKDEWTGVPLSALEGQQFTMEMTATLTSSGLQIAIGVVGDRDSLVGFGGHFAAAKNEGRLTSGTQEAPPVLLFDLNEKVEAIYHPFPDPLTTSIDLYTKSYRMQMQYRCKNAENAWQLQYNPETSLIYIAALAAKMPSRPILTVNSLAIELQISR